MATKYIIDENGNFYVDESGNLLSQTTAELTTLYSELFNQAGYNGAGRAGTTYDMKGVTNWTIENYATVGSTGYFKQVSASSRFESMNDDAVGPDTGTSCRWYSLETNIAGYTQISATTTLTRITGQSSSGVKAYYILDRGTPVLFGSCSGNTGGGGTLTAYIPNNGGNTNTYLQMLICHYGTFASGNYSHSAVSIEGWG